MTNVQITVFLLNKYLLFSWRLRNKLFFMLGIIGLDFKELFLFCHIEQQNRRAEMSFFSSATFWRIPILKKYPFRGVYTCAWLAVLIRGSQPPQDDRLLWDEITTPEILMCLKQKIYPIVGSICKKLSYPFSHAQYL